VEFRRNSDLAAALELKPSKAADLLRDTQEAWLVIMGGSLIAIFIAFALISIARGPISTVLVTVALLALILSSGFPIYWFTYQKMPEGVIVEILTGRRYAGALAVLIFLAVYWLLSLMSKVARRGEARAAA
jgi:hypothetical protein